MTCATPHQVQEDTFTASFFIVLKEQREYFKQLFLFSHHPLSGPSRITDTRFNAINSSSQLNNPLIVSSPEHYHWYLYHNLHTLTPNGKYCSHNKRIFRFFLVLWTNDCKPCGPQSMHGIFVFYRQLNYNRDINS